MELPRCSAARLCSYPSHLTGQWREAALPSRATTAAVRPRTQLQGSRLPWHHHADPERQAENFPQSALNARATRASNCPTTRRGLAGTTTAVQAGGTGRAFIPLPGNTGSATPDPEFAVQNGAKSAVLSGSSLFSVRVSH